MARELAVQTDIKRSTLAQGGYALKLSNRFTVGVPDLGIWLPPFAPFIAEVKDLGVVTDNFHVQIGVTPKQTDTMLRMSGKYTRPVAGLLIAATHRGIRKLFYAPHDETRIAALSFPFHVIRGVGGKYDIAAILSHAGVAKI